MQICAWICVYHYLWISLYSIYWHPGRRTDRAPTSFNKSRVNRVLSLPLVLTITAYKYLFICIIFWRIYLHTCWTISTIHTTVIYYYVCVSIHTTVIPQHGGETPSDLQAIYLNKIVISSLMTEISFAIQRSSSVLLGLISQAHHRMYLPSR